MKVTRTQMWADSIKAGADREKLGAKSNRISLELWFRPLGTKQKPETKQVLAVPLRLQSQGGKEKVALGKEGVSVWDIQKAPARTYGQASALCLHSSFTCHLSCAAWECV